MKRFLAKLWYASPKVSIELVESLEPSLTAVSTAEETIELPRYQLDIDITIPTIVYEFLSKKPEVHPWLMATPDEYSFLRSLLSYSIGVCQVTEHETTLSTKAKFLATSEMETRLTIDYCSVIPRREILNFTPWLCFIDFASGDTLYCKELDARMSINRGRKAYVSGHIDDYTDDYIRAFTVREYFIALGEAQPMAEAENTSSPVRPKRRIRV